MKEIDGFHKVAHKGKNGKKGPNQHLKEDQKGRLNQFHVLEEEEDTAVQNQIRQIHSRWLNKYEFIEVKAENTAGAILILWNPQKIGIIDAEESRIYLSVVIQPVGDRDTYLVTNVYGPQRLDDKIKFIDSLVDLKSIFAGLPWVIGGDFNMIRSLSEKKGGTRALNKDSSAFQCFLENMKLVDIETNIGLCTWNNKRGGYSQVASKLDKFMISEELLLLDKEVIADILPFGGSDHWPIQMEIKGIGTPRNKPFRFENMWLSHLDFINNIEKWWVEDLQIQGSSMFLLHKRLKHIKQKLKEWNQKQFGNIFASKKTVEIKILELNQALIKNGFDKDINDQAEKYHQEWERLCKQEEIFWKQKSRVLWLKEGEHNTKLFHISTIANRTHNRISSIKDENGQIHQAHEEIEAVLVKHFRDIAKENFSGREPFIKNLIKHIPKLVSREDNCNLKKPVTEKEISEVLKKMKNGKAPGLDGFNVDFFKACWNIVKRDIVEIVEDSRQNKTILKALNTSFIALIPKQDNDKTPERYRPIALCNVVNKIISKVGANRLKPLLPTLISGEQTGYVEGRQILDSIIQAHEVVHSLTCNKRARMIMQLDIAKAYDKVNWIYIKKVLTAFGFDHNWVRWVMAFVTSSNFSILVNGSPSEIFLPSKDLRQGDLLSPFLFILMMEGLGQSIKHGRVTGRIQGLQLTENGHVLTHQKFVDDTMLQGIPTVKEALAYKQILDDFAKAIGMEVNLTKSKVFFFNTHIAIQRNVSRILGFQRQSLPSKYLGVPLTAKP
eukprot:PITA_12543